MAWAGMVKQANGPPFTTVFLQLPAVCMLRKADSIVLPCLQEDWNEEEAAAEGEEVPTTLLAPPDADKDDD